MIKREARLRRGFGETCADWGVSEYERQAVLICQRYSLIPGVNQPYRGHSLVWRDTRYFYVSGVDSNGKPRLVEVFLVGPGGEMEPVFAINYPFPLRHQFPEDFAILFQP